MRSPGLADRETALALGEHAQEAAKIGFLVGRSPDAPFKVTASIERRFTTEAI